MNQILEKEKSNYLMVDILSNIVGSSCNGGKRPARHAHPRDHGAAAEALRRSLHPTRQPDLTPSFLALVVNASALHA